MTRHRVLKLALVVAVALIQFSTILSPATRPALAHQTAPPASAAYPDFAAWLADLRAEALARGIGSAVFDAAFDGVAPIPRIIELDRKQPEVTQTFEEYMARRITAKLVEEGRRVYGENRELLKRVGKKFGVQPRFIVALWGVETRFGKFTGGFSVVAALATLAFDGRRSAYFRGELFDALTILEQGHISPGDMMGSWAGAMGQSQFMPSSFLRYAVDFDGDKRRDIWTTKADVFASAANYLAQSGWRDDQTWGREVSLPAGFDMALADLKLVKRLSEWQRLGVRRADGGDLPKRDLKASLVLPGADSGPAYVIYSNYRTILKWNRSNYFAVSVGHLADLIGDR